MHLFLDFWVSGIQIPTVIKVDPDFLCFSLLIIDANEESSTMKEIYEKLAHKICKLIPKEMNVNCNIN